MRCLVALNLTRVKVSRSHYCWESFLWMLHWDIRGELLIIHVDFNVYSVLMASCISFADKLTLTLICNRFIFIVIKLLVERLLLMSIFQPFGTLVCDLGTTELGI